jgi:hypothetical protein
LSALAFSSPKNIPIPRSLRYLELNSIQESRRRNDRSRSTGRSPVALYRRRIVARAAGSAD